MITKRTRDGGGGEKGLAGRASHTEMPFDGIDASKGIVIGDPDPAGRGDMQTVFLERVGTQVRVVRFHTARPETIRFWAQITDGVVTKITKATVETTNERRARGEVRIEVKTGGPVGPTWTFRDDRFYPPDPEEGAGVTESSISVVYKDGVPRQSKD